MLGDLITRDVVTVTPQTPVIELARRLVERRISAVPVVNAENNVVGVVSEGDLLHRRELGTEARTSWWLEMFRDPDAAAREYMKAHGLVAADVMTSPAICTEESAPLATVAGLLERHGIKRLPVLRAGKLVGIISRADLVRALVARAPASPAPGAAADDRAIVRVLRERLKAEPWARSMTINFVVEDGIVELWGFARSEEQRNALRVLAQEIPGVRGVTDHLSLAHFTSAT
jgi:CBS domain-containing protein